jgi:hypothetical protein
VTDNQHGPKEAEFQDRGADHDVQTPDTLGDLQNVLREKLSASETTNHQPPAEKAPSPAGENTLNPLNSKQSISPHYKGSYDALKLKLCDDPESLFLQIDQRAWDALNSLGPASLKAWEATARVRDFFARSSKRLLKAGCIKREQAICRGSPANDRRHKGRDHFV